MNRLLTLILLSILLITQPFAAFGAGEATKVPVDESTVIFPGCRLSKLVDPNFDASKQPEENSFQAEANKAEAETRKNNYIKGCIQEIIRFIIIIASLAAILSIAASGLMSMYKPDNKIKSKITNLVIGLFLLIVGWNLLPILNQSFNNTNFLNLPAVNYCSASNACVDADVVNEKKFYSCVTKYETEIMGDKDYQAPKDLRTFLIKCIINFCQLKKTQYPKIDRDVCDDIKNSKDEAKISKIIDAHNAEGVKLRAARAAAGPSQSPGGNVPDSEIGKKVLEMLKNKKILDEGGNQDTIIKQVEGNKLKIPTLKMLYNLASSVDSITIWAPYRPSDPFPGHPDGLAVDLKAITVGGKLMTVEQMTAGQNLTEYTKLANTLYEGKTSRQVLMAGPMVDILRKDPKFSAPPKQGSIEKIRIGTTGGSNKTERHEDHWHIDMFK